jgi:hypothetical protein
MSTNNPDWFDAAATIAPVALGWRLHRGVLANGRVGWVLQEKEQAFHVLDVPETPSTTALIERIAAKAGPDVAETLVARAVVTMPDLIADTR